MEKKKVLLGMSGGVDSSVAAILLQEQGYEVYGVTLKLWEEEGKESTCCNLDATLGAKRVCDKLGIPHYTLNAKDQFQKYVIQDFICQYKNCRTPNPCIECNKYLKFGYMYQKAKELGIEYIATGHYAKVEEKDGWFYLKKGEDASKDQSYVLYSLKQEQLSHIIFPLGVYSKTEIRKIAEENNFLNARKKDSQDICFVPDGDYAEFIERYLGKTYPKGNFVDVNGNVLGEHQGIIRYTNGQRKGLGLAFGKPMYVADKNIDDNTVTLCTNDELFSKELTANDFNWLIPNPAKEIKCSARVRYNMREQPAAAYILDNGNVKVVFDEPQRAITKGQAVVLYDGETLLGGGTII